MGPRPTAMHLQKEFQQVQVVGLLPAVELEQAVDGGFQKQSIVDGIQAYAWLLGTASNKLLLARCKPSEQTPQPPPLWSTTPTATFLSAFLPSDTSRSAPGE